MRISRPSTSAITILKTSLERCPGGVCARANKPSPPDVTSNVAAMPAAIAAAWVKMLRSVMTFPSLSVARMERSAIRGFPPCSMRATSPSGATLNFQAGLIRLFVFRNFNGVDVGKDVGGDLLRHFLFLRRQCLVLVGALDRYADRRGVKRGTALAANNDVQLCLVGGPVAERRHVAGKGQGQLAAGFAAQEPDRNIGQLKSPIGRPALPAPDQLLPFLDRFLETSADRRDFEHGRFLERRKFPGIRPVGRTWLRTNRRRSQSRKR